MPRQYELMTMEGEIYLAGQRVAPGYYRQIGTRRELCLEKEDALPASLDGRAACYERIATRSQESGGFSSRLPSG